MDLNYTRDTTSGREGLGSARRVRTHDGTLPVVVMTGWGSIETAVEAMRRGARSFVQKPWDDITLVEVVRREIDEGLGARRRDAKRRARARRGAAHPARAAAVGDAGRCAAATSRALWTPASGIGGDCYDVLRFSDDRVAMSIADVVGKGLPAALLMSNLQAAVRAFATAAAEPQDVCTSVNRLLCRNIASGKFVTFCYAVVDTAKRTVSYANAGHFPPSSLTPTASRTAGADRARARRRGRLDVSTGSAQIGAGDRLVCFTDGITEATRPGR